MNEDALRRKIRRLSESVWENRASGQEVDEWLNVFTAGSQDPEFDRLCLLNLLSNFIYFGIPEVRELLAALYHELYRRPLLTEIRRSQSDPLNVDEVDRCFLERLRRTRFLGVGNPSESGSHLLYYLRQETGLPSELFINHFELPGFSGTLEDVDRYIFIDDLCGTGEQACSYSKKVVERVRSAAKDVEINYFALLATTAGLQRVRDGASYSSVECVMEMGRDFRCFDPNARFWTGAEAARYRERARALSLSFGRLIYAPHPLGFDDAELAVGFNHNTPDDTLPIFWVDASEVLPSLKPIFRRYEKAI